MRISHGSRPPAATNTHAIMSTARDNVPHSAPGATTGATADAGSLKMGSLDSHLAREAFLAWFQRGGGRHCGLPETKAWAEHAWAHMLPPILPEKPRQWSRSYWEWKARRGMPGAANSLASHEADIRAQEPTVATMPHTLPIEKPEHITTNAAARRVSRTRRSGVRLTVDGKWAVMTDVVKRALGTPLADDRDSVLRRMTLVGAKGLGGFPNATGGARNRIIALSDIDALLGYMMEDLHSGHLYESVKAYRAGAACKALVGVHSMSGDRSVDDRAHHKTKRQRHDEVPRTCHDTARTVDHQMLPPVSTAPTVARPTTTMPTTLADPDDTEDEATAGPDMQICAGDRSGGLATGSDNDDASSTDTTSIDRNTDPPAIVHASHQGHPAPSADQISAIHCDRSTAPGSFAATIGTDSRPDDIPQEIVEDSDALDSFSFILGDDDPLSDQEDSRECVERDGTDDNDNDGDGGCRRLHGRIHSPHPLQDNTSETDRAGPTRTIRDPLLRKRKQPLAASGSAVGEDKVCGGVNGEPGGPCDSPSGGHTSDSDCHADDSDYRDSDQEIEIPSKNSAIARRVRRRLGRALFGDDDDLDFC